MFQVIYRKFFHPLLRACRPKPSRVPNCSSNVSSCISLIRITLIVPPVVWDDGHNVCSSSPLSN